MFNFNYDCIKNGTPIVTISILSLSFNKAAADLLHNPDEVMIGFDKENNVIGVTIPDNGETTGSSGYPKFAFSKRMNHEWIRIGARDFIRYLSDNTKISFNPAIQFIPELDETGTTLLVFIDEMHMKKKPV